jgi:hypothetical protein
MKWYNVVIFQELWTLKPVLFVEETEVPGENKQPATSYRWWSVLFVEETEVPGKNKQTVTSHWQTLSYNIMLYRVQNRNHGVFDTVKL